MIKIAFVIDTIESPTAGTEKQLLMLIKHLDRTKFKPYLCVLRFSQWLDKEYGTSSVFVADIYSFKTIKGLRGVFSLSQYLKREKIDIVQTHFRDSSIAGILAAIFAGVKVIIGTRRNQGYWLTQFERKIQHYLDRWIAVYIANSESTRQWVIDNEGIDSNRIKVIYNGFQVPPYSAEPIATKGEMRVSFGVPEHAPVVVKVANLRPVKDHITFLKAARIVYNLKPDCRFIVIGGGTEQEKLREFAHRIGIGEVTIFLGERQDVFDILTMCDIGVLSSLSESFSNSIVEYMFAGLPVVTTDVGGVREAIDDGINGYIVPVGDYVEFANRIVTILTSGKSQGMGQESRRRSKDLFSLPTMIDRFEILYTSCLGGGI